MGLGHLLTNPSCPIPFSQGLLYCPGSNTRVEIITSGEGGGGRRLCLSFQERGKVKPAQPGQKAFEKRGWGGGGSAHQARSQLGRGLKLKPHRGCLHQARNLVDDPSPTHPPPRLGPRLLCGGSGRGKKAPEFRQGSAPPNCQLGPADVALAPEPRAAPSPPPARQASAAPVAVPSAPPSRFLLQQAGPPSRRVSQARAPSLPHAPAPGPAWAAERSSARQEPAPGGRAGGRTASRPAGQPASQQPPHTVQTRRDFLVGLAARPGAVSAEEGSERTRSVLTTFSQMHAAGRRDGAAAKPSASAGSRAAGPAAQLG